MKWSRTVRFALVACGLWALAALLTHERSQTPEEFLRSIEQRRAAGALPPEVLLRELALAQALAEHEGQQELATRVQLQRGRVLLDLGSYASARTEFDAVAAAGGAGAELELLRIELELRAGNPAAGLELGHSWLRAHPEDARAWSLCGELQRQQAEAPRAAALAACQKELVIESAARAAPWVRELCARPAADARRVALARDLRLVYGTRLEPAVESVLGLCDSAASAAAGARESFGRSLELRFDAETLAELAEMLEEAGLGEQALDLLTAASKRPELNENERAIRHLLRALVRRERWRFGTIVASTWLAKHPGSPEFMLDACRACYGALGTPESDAGRLYRWSMGLFQVRTVEFGAAPHFYVGEAFYSLRTREMLETAYLHLSQFALSEAPEFFPGARALAFRHLAECCRTLGITGEEREALETEVSLDPRGSGESWLRLAELQLASPHGGFRAPDLRWARGMALLPGRQRELLPRWLEIGAEELRALGLDPRSLQQDIQSGMRPNPSNGAAPFELYTFARAYLEARKFYEAHTLLQELLDAVPGFLPALELRVELAQAQGDKRELAEAFLARLEQTGFDERARTLRAALPDDALSLTDERRIVRADPDSSGRLAVARSFAARGEKRSALRFLLELPEARIGPEERLFAARLELDSGAPDAAFERLDALAENLGQTPGALEAWLEAGLRAGRIQALRERLPALITTLELDRARFLALSDRLLAAGESTFARGLLTRLDTAGKGFRGGDVLWRMAACAQALGQTEAYERLIERAAAFDTHGEVEMLALLGLPAEADSDARRAAVQAVRQAGWKSSALAKVALALLAEEPEALSEALARARAQQPQEPISARLAEASAGAATTRDLAVLVLTLERPALGAAALARLDALGDAAGPIWPAWIRARLKRAAGEREAEERLLRGLLEKEPSWVAAWDRLVELHSAAADEGECELDLRLERAAALGDASGTPAERDFDRSRRLEREGAFEPALDAARTAAAAAPASGPILRHLGRLAARMERLPAALVAYRRAIALLPAASGARSTAEYLELIASLGATEPRLLDAEAERSELEALAALRPDDPRVLLAQAKNDIETSASDPSFGAQRAAGRLTQFRERQAGRSFEELAAGSTEDWVRFLLALDPAGARAFLDAELDRDPGNLVAWALLPRCSAADGRDADALSEVAFVQRLAPGAEGLSEYLRVRARGDWTAEGVALISERLRRLDPTIGSSAPELSTEMRAYLNLGPRGVPKALQIGLALTPARLATQAPAQRAEAYWMHAVALLARGESDDFAEARRRVLVLEKLVRDPAWQPLVAALRGLAQPAKPAP